MLVVFCFRSAENYRELQGGEVGKVLESRTKRPRGHWLRVEVRDMLEVHG